jgi:hypothetical protein
VLNVCTLWGTLEVDNPKFTLSSWVVPPDHNLAQSKFLCERGELSSDNQ